MEVERKECPTGPQYPWIGKSKHDGVIVLFDSHQCGVVLDKERSCYASGSYRTDWYMPAFEKYCGEITLRN